MLDPGFWTLDTGYLILDAGYLILDAGFWTLVTCRLCLQPIAYSLQPPACLLLLVRIVGRGVGFRVVVLNPEGL